jgi:hypothetical protein
MGFVIAFQMANGGIGVPSLIVVSPAEEGINHKPDSATNLHLPMEEQSVLEKILTLHLAILRNAQLVKLFCNKALKPYKKFRIAN